MNILLGSESFQTFTSAEANAVLQQSGAAAPAFVLAPRAAPSLAPVEYPSHNALLLALGAFLLLQG